jgi:hypothetical protein
MRPCEDRFVAALDMSLRKKIGRASFVLAIIFIAWIPLGALRMVPFVLDLSGEPSLRVHASAAVGLLMIAAWGFWE